jgi:hypothetical protein
MDEYAEALKIASDMGYFYDHSAQSWERLSEDEYGYIHTNGYSHTDDLSNADFK